MLQTNSEPVSVDKTDSTLAEARVLFVHQGRLIANKFLPL
jgi:hypothetical protein